MRARNLIATSLLSSCALGLQAQSLAASLELPNSPGFTKLFEQSAQAPASQVRTASIVGVVLDVNQGIVPDAKISLSALGAPASSSSSASGREVTSDAVGHFKFTDLPAGKYIYTITSVGLETFVSSEFSLRDGQQLELPKIALPIASTASDVTVRVTESQLADEQIEAEMHQRVFGILPNFYSSYVWDAAPLQSKQKFKMAVRARSDPFVFIATGIVASVQFARDTPKYWGQDLPGYGQRYGAAFATGTLSRFFGSAVYPVIFHQDPRYFYKGSGSFGSRAWYAMTRSVVARGDNGKWQPNYSHILGGLTAGAISNLYHPGHARGASLTFENAGLGIGFTAAGNLVREFVLRRVTHGVADFNNGEKPIVAKDAKSSK